MSCMVNSELFPSTPDDLRQIRWIPTREAGLARLAAFIPHAGNIYARGRNADLGPSDRSNVSALSPYLARRMITENEVVEAVLRAHNFAACEKFIQEVFWRTYWKGWLELRPDVLVQFDTERKALKASICDDDDLKKRIQAATSGQTGIDCFDAWVHELTTLGWLHNHARMWFASIWIFTLGLPWQLGADFFYKHLLDADAASNTLSWRWVGGLQTKGKHYVARASNITTHTHGRFNPSGQLNENAFALCESYQLPGPVALQKLSLGQEGHVGLLLTQDDLHPSSLEIGAKVVGAAVFSQTLVQGEGTPAFAFSQGALDDAQLRVEQDSGVSVERCSTANSVAEWAKKIGVKEVVMAYAPTGLLAWSRPGIETALAREGIKLVQIRRDWDTQTWPLATGGFFKLKEKLPSLINRLVPT
jgi:deoxyribodipyrimidine photo-lyase